MANILIPPFLMPLGSPGSSSVVWSDLILRGRDLRSLDFKERCPDEERGSLLSAPNCKSIHRSISYFGDGEVGPLRSPQPHLRHYQHQRQPQRQQQRRGPRRRRRRRQGQHRREGGREAGQITTTAASTSTPLSPFLSVRLSNSPKRSTLTERVLRGHGGVRRRNRRRRCVARRSDGRRSDPRFAVECRDGRRAREEESARLSPVEMAGGGGATVTAAVAAIVQVERKIHEGHLGGS